MLSRVWLCGLLAMLALPVLAVAVSHGLYQQTQAVLTSSSAVIEAYELISGINRVQARSADADVNQVRYLVTRSPYDRGLWDRASAAFRRELNAVTRAVEKRADRVEICKQIAAEFAKREKDERCIGEACREFLDSRSRQTESATKLIELSQTDIRAESDKQAQVIAQFSIMIIVQAVITAAAVGALVGFSLAEGRRKDSLASYMAALRSPKGETDARP